MPAGIEYAQHRLHQAAGRRRRRRRHAGTAAASRTSSRSTTRPASCGPRSRRRATSTRRAARLHRGRELPARGRRQRPAVPADRGARRLRRVRPDQRDRLLRPGHRQADQRPGRRGRRLHDAPRCAWTAATSSRTSGPRTTRAARSSASTAARFKQTCCWRTRRTESVRDAETSFSPDYAEFLYASGRLFMSERLISKPVDVLVGSARSTWLSPSARLTARISWPIDRGPGRPGTSVPGRGRAPYRLSQVAPFGEEFRRSGGLLPS